MLTTESLQKRKWGRFPAMRKALEDKRIPDTYYGPTSVSDNVFDSLSRLVEIAILVHEYESSIRDTAQIVGKQQMWDDLLSFRTNWRAHLLDFDNTQMKLESYARVCRQMHRQLAASRPIAGQRACRRDTEHKSAPEQALSGH